jgi:hypothetical protein
MSKDRNLQARPKSKVRFVTGLSHPKSEQIEHTGTIICPLFPDSGWMARSDQTGETWALKLSEPDWELID